MSIVQRVVELSAASEAALLEAAKASGKTPTAILSGMAEWAIAIEKDRLKQIGLRKTLIIPVQFKGTVEVLVPKSAKSSIRDLAECVALHRVIANLQPQDHGPLDEIVEDYRERNGLDLDEAWEDFEHSEPTGVSGTWTLRPIGNKEDAD